jgi:hypothetical protein
MPRRGIFAAIALLALLTGAPAEGTVTLGQVAPVGFTPNTCGPSSGAYTQPTVTSGNSYLSQVSGTISSWSTRATGNTNQQMALKIFRPLGNNAYLTVSQDGPHPLTPSAVNTFPTPRLAVNAGDVLGVDTSGTGNLVGCSFQVPGETIWGSFPEDPDTGEQATFFSTPNYRVNASAELDPSSAFIFGETSRNKKKGRATTTVSLPGPGTVVLQGKGLKVQSVTTTLRSVALGVIPNAKTRKKLARKGKALVTAAVTFTPTGGTANTQSETIKLVRKR